MKYKKVAVHRSLLAACAIVVLSTGCASRHIDGVVYTAELAGVDKPNLRAEVLYSWVLPLPGRDSIHQGLVPHIPSDWQHGTLLIYVKNMGWFPRAGESIMPLRYPPDLDLDAGDIVEVKWPYLRDNTRAVAEYVTRICHDEDAECLKTRGQVGVVDSSGNVLEFRARP